MGGCLGVATGEDREDLGLGSGRCCLSGAAKGEVLCHLLLLFHHSVMSISL